MRGAAWAAFSLLFFANYFPAFRWMVARWDEPASYMSHGWLIPPISAFLLWQRRREIASLPRGPAQASAWGFPVIIVSLLLHLTAGLADVSSLSGLTLVGVLLGFVLLVEGKPTAKAAWFPILFLALMVPPPEFVIDKLNFSLKLMAADIATSLLDLVGLPAIRQGSYMIFGDEKLAVGDVCSGLRSLLALLDLGVLYAYLVRERGRAGVGAALAMAVPAAIVGNGLRIFLVACLVIAFGQAAVFKPLVGSWDLHLFTGAFIFIAAFGCLYLAVWAVDRLSPAVSGREPVPRAEPVQKGVPMTARRQRAWLAASLLALAAAAALSESVLFKQVVQGQTDLARNIPRQLGAWQLVDEQTATPSEVQGLETRDIIKRTYSDGREYMELVVAYIAHSSRKSAHAQEACLRGAGALVGSIGKVSWENGRVNGKLISIDVRDQREWVCYWYKIGDTYTADYLASSLRMFLGGLIGEKIQGASLVRILTPEARGESQARIESRMQDFTHALLPELKKALP
ncbi:MAG: EpsI family protein [Fibrobacteres bacterium]|nr:EpsI family protein [Fibrobacterota bacterium]